MNAVTPGTITPAVTPPLKNPLIGFRNHFIVYAVVVALLGALNYFTGQPYWALYVLAGWGIGIVAHGLAAVLKKSSAQA